LICTPGRLIEMVKKKATNFLRTSYVVLDEADKMFQMVINSYLSTIRGLNLKWDRFYNKFDPTDKLYSFQPLLKRIYKVLLLIVLTLQSLLR